MTERLGHVPLDEGQRAQNGERRVRVEQEFPEDPWERLNRVLSSFNRSPKAVTHLLLDRYTGSSFMDPGELVKRFREIYRGEPIFDFSRDTVLSYCHDSLVAVGLVAEEKRINTMGQEKVIGYGQSHAGEKYGLPTAANMLFFEEQHNLSLYPVFGSTNTNSQEERRAPLTRAMILMELALGEKRKVDLEKNLSKGQSSITTALQQLSQAGVIEYEAVTTNTGKKQVTYVLNNLEIEIQGVKGTKILTEKIARTAQGLREQGISITQNNIFLALPEEIGERRKEQSLRKQITNTLSGLEKQGYLSRGKFKGGEIFSSAQLTTMGKVLVDDLLVPMLDALSDGKTLETWRREILPKVIGNLQLYAQTTGQLYYPYSMSARIKEHTSHLSHILEILENKASSLTGNDIHELLRQSKIILSQKSVVYLTRELVKSGKVLQETRKGANYYSLAPLPEFSEDLLED